MGNSNLYHDREDYYHLESFLHALPIRNPLPTPKGNSVLIFPSQNSSFCSEISREWNHVVYTVSSTPSSPVERF